MRTTSVLLLVVLLGGCATTPSIPDWTGDPARLVDNGYIVYTGSGQESDPNEAQLAAEGTAVQDLASECSFVPKGARVENHFRLKTKNGFEAYAQVAIDFQTCISAQQAVKPEDIQKLASVPFADELKRYQALIDAPPPVSPVANPGATTVVADDDGYFLARQYVFYQKQVVILAPPGAYAPGSAATQTYLNNVTPVMRPMQTYYAANPRLSSAGSTWSQVEPRVRRRYARAFRAPARRARVHRRPKRRPNKRRKRKNNN